MSEEDKIWLERIFDVKLSGLEGRIDAKLASLENRIDDRIDSKIQASEDRMIEKMRDIETTMLTEFQKWASHSDIRARSHDAVLRAHGSQLEMLEDRIAKLEMKKQ